MFASTRPLIHQTLYLSVANNRKILTGREWEKFHLSTTERNLRALRFLSHAGGSGLFQYTRRVYFRSYKQFTPDILLPHLDRFRTLKRVHTLTMEDSSCLGREWEGYHKTCFAHFYPTLTSLTIRDGHVESFQAIMQFVLQFPNLENLSLERVYRSGWSGSRWPVPDDFDRPPRLCGHLRLAGGDALAMWPVDPTHKLSRIFHFRSVELTDVGESDVRILNTFVGSLEDLTVVPRGEGTRQPSFSSPTTADRLADFAFTRAQLVTVSRSQETHYSPPVYVVRAVRSEVRLRPSGVRR